MPKTPIDECPAGPWLDAVAAAFTPNGVDPAFVHYVRTGEHPWNPSTDIAMAIGLAEKEQLFLFPINREVAGVLMADVVWWVAGRWPSSGYMMFFPLEPPTLMLNSKVGESWNKGFCAYASDMALAITRAFCKANGITEVEVPDD